MNGLDLVRELDRQETGDHHFIKWWRKENDFIDIELIDHFKETVKGNDVFGGYELLTMEQLWDIVVRLCPGRVSRVFSDGHESIIWERIDKHGIVRCIKCTFAPEFLIQIFDIETHGNYIE